MDPRRLQIDYGGPEKADPGMGGDWTSYNTLPEALGKVANLWYTRLLGEPIKSMGAVGAGLLGNVPQIGVDDSTDLRKVGGQYVAPGGTGGVGDIMNALLLYGGPGIATGKPGMASVGVFGGEKALGANLAMKQIAEKALAAGKDPDEVRKITGWFKGMEGKPRFEIDDSAMKLKVNLDERPNIQGMKLGEVIEYEEVFKQYPELANKRIDMNVGKGVEKWGGFTEAYDKDFSSRAPFTVQGPNVASAKDTLVHEIQHWIQQKEGFARGSDPKTETLTAMRESPASEALFGPKAEEVGFKRYQLQAGEIEARDVSARRTWDVEMREAVPPDLRKDAIIRWGSKESYEIFKELAK